MIPYILLLIGLLCIFVEFYLPGGLLAILGAIIILASIITFIQQTESVAAIFLYLLGVGISVGFLIKYTLRLISKTQTIFLHRDQEGYVASSYDKNAIGKVGVVISDLKPAGYILVDGKKAQAISVSGYIAQGTEVIVLRGTEESLVVTQLTQKK